MISYIVLRIHLIKILTINYCVTQVILASAMVSQNFRVHVIVGQPWYSKECFSPSFAVAPTLVATA